MRIDLKCKVIFLGVMSSLSLFANNSMHSTPSDFNSNPQHQTEYESNPPFGPFLQKRLQGFVSAEFLYWYNNLSEVPLYQVRETISTGSTIVTPAPRENITTKTGDFEVKWNPGVRVAAGMLFDRDGWDLQSEWTYYYNNTTTSKNTPLAVIEGGNFVLGSKTLLSPWALDPGESYTSIHGSYNLQFNQIDLLTGRHYWISRFLTCRPFFGVRGFWSSLNLSVKQKFNATSDTLTDVIFKQDQERIKQTLWGVGLLAGIDTSWYFADHWSFKLATDVALAYGKSNHKRLSDLLHQDEQGATTLDENTSYFHASYVMTPILDLGLGIQWDSILGRNNQYYLSFLAGWESHYLLDFSYLDRNFEDFNEVTIFSSDGNLTLSGINLRILFQF